MVRHVEPSSWRGRISAVGQGVVAFHTPQRGMGQKRRVDTSPGRTASTKIGEQESQSPPGGTDSGARNPDHAIVLVSAATSTSCEAGLGVSWELKAAFGNSREHIWCGRRRSGLRTGALGGPT